jgi:hypothetical protein
METTSITLHALRGTPLAERRVRDMVVAAAHALGERHGVDVLRVEAAPDRITCTIAGDRIVALGFAAELRRSTGAWYEHTQGVGDMWGSPRVGSAEDDRDGSAPADPAGGPEDPSERGPPDGRTDGG